MHLSIKSRHVGKAKVRISYFHFILEPEKGHQKAMSIYQECRGNFSIKLFIASLEEKTIYLLAWGFLLR